MDVDVAFVVDTEFAVCVYASVHVGEVLLCCKNEAHNNPI